MELRTHLMCIFAAVVFVSHAAAAFCEVPKSSEEMDDYLENPIEYNSYKEKHLRSFSDKALGYSRTKLFGDTSDEPSSSVTYEYRNDKKESSFPDKCVREKKTYQLSKSCKLKTENEVRHHSDGKTSSGINLSITWGDDKK